MSARPQPVEESRLARGAVLAAMLIALAGIGITASLPVSAAVCAVLVIAGHRRSWLGRHRPRTRSGQFGFGLLLLGAVLYLLLDLFGGVFGGAPPQANFTLAAAAITAFDLKSRRNLFSYLWHSLIVLYIAGLFAWSAIFLVVVVAWGLCVVALYNSSRQGHVSTTQRRRPRLGRAAPLVALWLISAIAVFVVLPELPGRPLAVPVLVSVPNFHARGESLPAALPLIGTQPVPGGGSIDLRARGRFGDEVAFHVRATGGGYWRAYSLQLYTGQQWVRGDPAQVPINSMGGRVHPDGERFSAGFPTLSQTFFIEGNLPTELLGVYPISETYYPGGSLRTLADGTVEAPSALVHGSSYGVVSVVRDTSERVLRSAAPLTEFNTDPQYLGLPDTVTQRTRDLAAQLTSRASTEYDQVMALQRHLSTHLSYSLDTPRLQDGNDAVDQFIFVDHVGFCEQFASALTVMLRSQGIPARLAVGFASSDRDVLTGTFTVRNHDAHAWAEVYFPGVGWVPFDASPGFDSSPTSTANPTSFLSFDSLVKIGGVPGGAAAVGSAAVLLVAVTGLVAFVRRWRRRAAMDPVLRRYGDELRRLRRRRLPGRDPTETVAEHLRRLEAVADEAAARLRPYADAVEALLYRRHSSS